MKHTTKNPIGRPRNAGPDVLPIFDSMKACQGACGVPIHIQKRAKAAGCPAFRAGRIYLSDLLKWLFARDADDGVDWDRRWKRARAEREELKLKQEKGEVISRGHRVEQLNEVLRKLRAIADEAIPDRKAFYDFCKRAQDLGDIFDT